MRNSAPNEAARESELRTLLSVAYSPDTVDELVPRIEKLITRAKAKSIGGGQKRVDESDVMLITYGDSLMDHSRTPLEVLDRFLRDRVAEVISNVHIFPAFPRPQTMVSR